MRILLVSHYALPHMGGIEVLVEALAYGFAAEGHAVTHVAARVGAEADEVAGRPYRVVTVPAINVIERKFGLPVPILGPELWRVLRREIAAADVVHAHGMLYQTSASALLMARRRAHQCRVLTEHVGHVRYDSRVVNLVESLAIATLGRRCVHAAHALVTYNDRVAQEMQSLAPGVPRVTIRNGVDFERFHPAADDRGRLRRELGWDDRPRVLLVGRMVEKKGVGIAIEAANRLGGAVELVLAGPGQPPRPSPNVRYLGSLSRERIAEVYRACDLFLLPSRGEGFPLAVQEAMASGLPVILAGDPGYVETLRGSGDAVALVEPDVESVVTAIRSLLLRDLRFLGEEATRFARERFGWRAAVEQHLALYRQIISGTTPAR